MILDQSYSPVPSMKAIGINDVEERLRRVLGIKEQMQRLQDQAIALLKGEVHGRTGFKMSEEARAKISAAKKKWWKNQGKIGRTP